MTTSTDTQLLFVVDWLDRRQERYSSTPLRRRNLTAAIKSAANMLANGRDPQGQAHGFFVRRAEGGDA